MHNDTMILKHPLGVRMFHYLLILSFLPLAVTRRWPTPSKRSFPMMKSSS